MGIIKCVVPGCEDRHSPRHRFPVFDQELYEEWLKRVGNKELVNLDPKFIRTNKRICSVHFSSHCRVPNSTKLKNRSLPTLHLPDFKESPNEDNSFLKYPYSKPALKKSEIIRLIKDSKPDPEDGSKSVRRSVSSVPTNSRPRAASPPCPIKSHLPESVETEEKPAKTLSAATINDSSYLNGIPTCEVDCEPVTIDFTYLMKITSLPDTPLIEKEPSQSKVATETLLNVSSKPQASSLQCEATPSPDGAVAEAPNCGNATSFDLEELIREHCEDLSAFYT